MFIRLDDCLVDIDRVIYIINDYYWDLNEDTSTREKKECVTMQYVDGKALHFFYTFDSIYEGIEAAFEHERYHGSRFFDISDYLTPLSPKYNPPTQAGSD